MVPSRPKSPDVPIGFSLEDFQCIHGNSTKTNTSSSLLGRGVPRARCGSTAGCGAPNEEKPGGGVPNVACGTAGIVTYTIYSYDPSLQV